MDNRKEKKYDSSHHSINPTKQNFSFMSTNLEPFVQNLMNNKTSASFLDKVDVNLLNPYRDVDINKEKDKNFALNHHPLLYKNS